MITVIVKQEVNLSMENMCPHVYCVIKTQPNPNIPKANRITRCPCFHSVTLFSDVLNQPVEEVMGNRLVNSHSSLLLQDLLQRSEAVHHHHGVWVPQQAVQLVHHCGIWKNHYQELWWPHVHVWGHHSLKESMSKRKRDLSTRTFTFCRGGG